MSQVFVQYKNLLIKTISILLSDGCKYTNNRKNQFSNIINSNDPQMSSF